MSPAVKKAADSNLEVRKMAKGRSRLAAVTGAFLALVIMADSGVVAEAGGNSDYLGTLNAGIATILDPSATNSMAVVNRTGWVLNLRTDGSDRSMLVMTNVKDALNVRADASEDAEKVGKMYKDCGGTILERKNGWTKIQSGNLIGWCKDEYLLFDEEAEEVANDVGQLVAYIESDALRVRKEPSTDADVYGLLPRDEMVEVVETRDDGWLMVNYDGNDGYVKSAFAKTEFMIDSGETMEEIKIREEAEKEAKRHKNYGQYTTDVDTKLLLAALIHCEARGEPYEGKLAVGAVVMNRVRSGAYPDTIHAVIYASGQFTPAMSGKVNRVLESGKINAECLAAAEEALSGVSNVGDLTHFRRNNGTREGLVIGHHVFF